MRQPEVTKHVARIVCLDATLDGNGKLTATTRWIHERPPA